MLCISLKLGCCLRDWITGTLNRMPSIPIIVPWWRHQMGTFSALLALCAGNSPVTGEFPAQRPLRRSFDVFFDLRLNNREAGDLRRHGAHYDVTEMTAVLKNFQWNINVRFCVSAGNLPSKANYVTSPLFRRQYSWSAAPVQWQVCRKVRQNL